MCTVNQKRQKIKPQSLDQGITHSILCVVYEVVEYVMMHNFLDSLSKHKGVVD